MEGEHTPTIIQLIRSTDLAIIQFKDSHIYSSYSNKKLPCNGKSMQIVLCLIFIILPPCIL